MGAQVTVRQIGNCWGAIEENLWHQEKTFEVRGLCGRGGESLPTSNVDPRRWDGLSSQRRIARSARLRSNPHLLFDEILLCKHVRIPQEFLVRQKPYRHFSQAPYHDGLFLGKRHVNKLRVVNALPGTHTAIRDNLHVPIRRV